MSRAANFFQLLTAGLLCLVISLVPFEQLLEGSNSPVGIFSISAIAIICWLFFRLLARDQAPSFLDGISKFSLYSFFGLFAVLCLSTLCSLKKDDLLRGPLELVTFALGDESFREIIKLILFALLAFAARDAFQKIRHRDLFLLTIITTVTISCTWALYWYNAYPEMRASRYRLTVPGLGFNNFAFFLLLFILLIIGQAWLEWKKKSPTSIILAMLIGIMLTCIFLVQSRAIFAQVVFSVFLFGYINYPFLRSRKAILIQIPLIFILVVSAFLLNSFHSDFIKRIGSAFDSFSNRYEDYAHVRDDYFANDPLLGVGPGRYLEDAILQKTRGRSNVDGAYLTYLIEMGLLGLIAWLVFYASILHLHFRELDKTKTGPPEIRMFSIVLAIILVNFLLNGLVESAITNRRFQVIFWVQLGLFLAIKGNNKGGVENLPEENTQSSGLIENTVSTHQT